MKFSVRKLLKPENKSLALFSRLTGLRIAGLMSDELPSRKDENTQREKEKLSVRSKKTKVVKLCQNQQLCQQQLNCQPAKNHSYHASIDLWFCLSPQS